MYQLLHTTHTHNKKTRERSRRPHARNRLISEIEEHNFIEHNLKLKWPEAFHSLRHWRLLYRVTISSSNVLSVRDENTNIISDTYISQHFEPITESTPITHTHTHTTHTHTYKQMIFTKSWKTPITLCPRVITRSPDFGGSRGFRITPALLQFTHIIGRKRAQKWALQERSWVCLGIGAESRNNPIRFPDMDMS